MKRMISKIMLATLMIGSLPIHAGLGQSMQNGTRTVLQGIGSNSGRIAGVIGGLVALGLLTTGYDSYLKIQDQIKEIKAQRPISCDDQEKLNELNKINKNYGSLVSSVSLFLGSLAAGATYILSKTCGWMGSKI